MVQRMHYRCAPGDASVAANSSDSLLSSDNPNERGAQGAEVDATNHHVLVLHTCVLQHFAVTLWICQTGKGIVVCVDIEIYSSRQ